jgi:hypothetical protein
VLWSEAVAAEVLVFFFLGPNLLRAVSPVGALAVAAFCGVLRWGVLAQTVDLVALGLVQPLHGFTFALFHLAAMRIIGDTVSRDFAATAQAVYGLVAVGGARPPCSCSRAGFTPISEQPASGSWQRFARRPFPSSGCCSRRSHHSRCLARHAEPAEQSAVIAREGRGRCLLSLLSLLVPLRPILSGFLELPSSTGVGRDRGLREQMFGAE